MKKYVVMILIFLFFLPICNAHTAKPTELCILTVYCWESDGSPAEGIMVRVDGFSSGQAMTWRHTTNEEGIATFTLSNIEPEYTVRAGRHVQQVTLTEAQTIEFMVGGGFVSDWIMVILIIIMLIIFIFIIIYIFWRDKLENAFMRLRGIFSRKNKTG